MSRKSKSTFTLAILGLLFLPVTPSFAHAQVTSTSPIRDAVLSEVPAEVMIEFDGDLTVIEDLNINVLKVFNSAGKQIDDGNTLVGGARLTVGITDRTGTGTFRVTYRVVSEDGHPVENEFNFKVSETDNSAKPAPIAEPEANSVTDEASLDSKSSEHHESFFAHHVLHIIEISAVALLILIWWFVERRRQR
jgi:methionine-rich copper-binding protein CopC